MYLSPSQAFPAYAKIFWEGKCIPEWSTFQVLLASPQIHDQVGEGCKGETVYLIFAGLSVIKNPN
jgi:hypothetical protein